MSETPARLLTVKEAAERLKLHTGSVRRLIASGRIPASKVGHEWRVPLVFIESLETSEKAA